MMIMIMMMIMMMIMIMMMMIMTELEADPGFARLTSGGEFSPDCKSEHSGNMIT